MKTHLRCLLVALLLLPFLSRAQDTAYFTISIIDREYLPTVEHTDDHVNLTFSQGDLNGMATGYMIYSFAQAYPESHLEHLRQVYLVSANSIDFMQGLQDAYPDVFITGKRVPRPVWLYTPNDFGKAFGNRQEELKLIRAEQAWNIDTGGSNIVIGMTDDWVHRAHADLTGKFVTTGAYTNPDSNYAGNVNHGSAVAGIIAGRTNNNLGLASIGFACKISNAPFNYYTGYSGPWGDQMVLKMSQDGLKVVNCSWESFNMDTIDWGAIATWADIYNEIYENGTTVICGAGNSGLPYITTQGSDTAYQFPASYEHNISVSSVGHLRNPILPYDSANHEENVKDYFQSYFPDYAGYGHMTHNSRVDICAPGFAVKSTVVNRFVPPNSLTTLDYDTALTGSSLSAPFVSGTVGLMMHTAKCTMTPYQIEFVLKSQADNLNSIAANARFVGHMGAGRLNAENAVSYVSTHKNLCNDTALSTMYIEGYDINTLCAPGFASPSGTHPVIKPRVINGHPPYTCRWVALPGNCTKLSNYAVINPSVDSSWNARYAYYEVTITDATSPVPKVATTRIKINLKTGGGYDLAMRDSHFDMMDEPNTQAIVDSRNWYLWASPDLWNRKNKDSSIIPQNVEFFSSGDSNFMYVRVRNIGCAASPSPTSGTPAKLKMYWTWGGTGEKWDGDWKNKNIPGFGGGNVAAGREITPSGGLAIPQLAVGDTVLMVQPWRPVDPKTYAARPDSVEVCGLARIETNTTTPFGMHTLETFNVSITANVRNNNNIVTRNMMDANLGHAHANKITYHPWVGNADETAQNFSFRLLTERDIHPHFSGSLSDYVYATVYLGPLYDRWVEGGRLGVTGPTDDSLKTVAYDPATPLRLDNIHMEAGDSFQVAIEFALRDTTTFFEFPISTAVHFQQLSGGGTDSEIYGNVSYMLNIEADDTTSGGVGGGLRQAPPRTSMQSQSYAVFPNPTSGMLSLQYLGDDKTIADLVLTDVNGKVVMRKRNLSLSSGGIANLKITSLAPGTYILQVTDANKVNWKQKIIKQ